MTEEDKNQNDDNKISQKKTQVSAYNSYLLSFWYLDTRGQHLSHCDTQTNLMGAKRYTLYSLLAAVWPHGVRAHTATEPCQTSSI